MLNKEQIESIYIKQKKKHENMLNTCKRKVLNGMKERGNNE